MAGARTARIWHLATAAVGAFALVVQLVLVISGVSVLVTEDPPGLGERLLHFVSYFTIQSNLVVLVSALLLARRPKKDGAGFGVVRLAGLVGITVTGLVHWFLLRPLLELTGWSYATDKLLHLVVPTLAVIGWLLFGPRPRITLRIALLGLIWPVAWLVGTLLVGAATGWYPYPFLDVGARGAGPVAVASLLVALAFFAISGLFWTGDRRLPPRPGRPVSSTR